MVMPIHEWPNEGNSGSEKLDSILAQKGYVRFHAFRIFNQQEMHEFHTARPYMSNEDQGAIVEAIHTKDFVKRVAEAIGKVRAKGKLELETN